MTDSTTSSFNASALEALLFLSGEPVRPEEIARAVGCTENDVSAALNTLEQSLQGGGRGLRVIHAADGIQLVTAPEHGEMIERYIKAGIREQLTPAAAETLAIVAYRGPISRAGVEAIRGVNSSFTLRLLTIRGLVDRMLNPSDARMFLYQVSAAFLRHLGVPRIEDLPDYTEMHAHEAMKALEHSVVAKEASEKPATEAAQEEGGSTV